MKNKVMGIFVIILIIAVAVFPFVCVLNVSNDYTYTVIAIAINDNEVVTDDGNIWAVEDTLVVNGFYKVTFNAKKIRNPYDDEIIAIKLIKNPVENLDLEIIELDEMNKK
jgi:hypothetical protein